MINLWTNVIYPVLHSPATTTLVAIISATTVFVIYFIRRRDHKRDAANIVLLELKTAERNLAEAKKSYESGQQGNPPYISFPERLRLMKTESWTKYKYLFVRDFEPEEWDKIGEYYDNARNFDEALEHKDSAFRRNEAAIRDNLQRNIADYAKDLAEKLKPNPDNDVTIFNANKKLEDEMAEKAKNAWQGHLRMVDLYNPDKSFKDAAYYYNLMPENMLDTPTGQKLKKLAKTTKRKRFSIF